MRKEVARPPGVLLLKKPAQEFVEGRVWKSRRRAFRFLGHCVRRGLLRNRYVHYCWRHFFYQRCEALLLDQGNRRGHALRCSRSGLRGDWWIFSPHQRRKSERRPQPETKGRSTTPVEPNSP